jgi:uncharacterized membrane protein YgcG
MIMIVMVAALGTILFASSFPAAAQNGDPCPPDSAFPEGIPTPGFGAGFVCSQTVEQGGMLFCPEGFVLEEFPIPNGVQFACAAVGQDGGVGGGGDSGAGGSGGGSGSGGAGGGSWGAAPVSQEGQQDSEAGEIEQTFNISHTPS